MDSKSVQNRPPEGPKSTFGAPDGPGGSQEGPESSQGPPTDCPGRPRGVPRRPQGHPRRPQEAQNVAQGAPKGPTGSQNRAQNGPKLDSGCQFGRKPCSKQFFDRFCIDFAIKNNLRFEREFREKVTSKVLSPKMPTTRFDR